MQVFRVRRGTLSDWSLLNPILLDGEIGYETDTRLFKVGNGTDRWTDLLYALIEGAEGPEGPEGPQGPVGPALTIKGAVDTYGDLPPSPTQYDFYIVLDTGHGWMWDGAAWVDIGEIRGPAGADGVDGQDGERGIQGLKGDKGDKGDTGDAGQWIPITLAEYEAIEVKDPGILYVVSG